MVNSRGPWRAAIGSDENKRPKPNEDETEIACLPHYRYDALDVFGPELGRQLTYEELEGNANLIAAAPDLLEASENILFRIRNIGYWNKPDTEMYIKALEAAVEKAKGE